MGEGKAFVVHYRQLWDKNLEGRRVGAAHAVDLVLKMQSTASSALRGLVLTVEVKSSCRQLHRDGLMTCPAWLSGTGD
jgi:hypothetical protein